MSTFLRTALTATLALSALIVLARSSLVRAEASPPNGLAIPQVESQANSVHAPICSGRRFTEPLQTSFDPEPTVPPTRTGGSGTH